MPLLTCARCGKQERKRVVYGYPSPELMEEASRGEVVLGGCEVGVPVASWLCDDCDSQVTDAERLECARKQLEASEEFQRETRRRLGGASDPPTPGKRDGAT